MVFPEALSSIERPRVVNDGSKRELYFVLRDGRELYIELDIKPTYMGVIPCKYHLYSPGSEREGDLCDREFFETVKNLLIQ